MIIQYDSYVYICVYLLIRSTEFTLCITNTCNLKRHARCRSFSTKEPLNIGLFCGKWPIKIRDPMSLRHPVSVDTPYRIHVVYDVHTEFTLCIKNRPVVSWVHRETLIANHTRCACICWYVLQNVHSVLRVDLLYEEGNVRRWLIILHVVFVFTRCVCIYTLCLYLHVVFVFTRCVCIYTLCLYLHVVFVFTCCVCIKSRSSVWWVHRETLLDHYTRCVCIGWYFIHNSRCVPHTKK